MARKITFEAIAVGTLEDRRLDDQTWLRIALTAPGSAHAEHVALDLQDEGNISINASAYQAMWWAAWEP